MWNLFGKKKKESEHRTLQLITDKGMPFGYVEAYKSLRTNLDFMAGSMDVHTLVITSTVPEEVQEQCGNQSGDDDGRKRQKGGAGGLRPAQAGAAPLSEGWSQCKGRFQRAVQPVHAGRGAAGTEGNES